MKRWLVVIHYIDPNGNPYYAPLQYADHYNALEVLRQIKRWQESLQLSWRFIRADVWRNVEDPMTVHGEGELMAHLSRHNRPYEDNPGRG